MQHEQIWYEVNILYDQRLVHLIVVERIEYLILIEADYYGALNE